MAVSGAVIIGGIVLGAVAAAGAGYAAYSASQQQANQYAYQAKLAKNRATQEQYAAQVRAENQRLHDMRVMGAQRAALGASGIASDEGSPLLVMMDSYVQGKIEEARLRYGGQVRADQLVSESRYLSHQAGQTRELSNVNLGVSLLGGAARAATQYGAYSQGQQPDTNTDYGGGYQNYRRGERRSYQ